MQFSGNQILSALVIALLLSSLGCQQQKGPLTVKVTGQVTFDGAPLPEGDIIFRRADGDQKGFGGRIENGSYQIVVEPGKMAVEIAAKRVVPGKFDDINGRQDPLYEMYIPKKYNAETNLVADVSMTQKEPIPFVLTSK